MRTGAPAVGRVALVAVFVLGFVVVSSVAVVRGRLLDDGLYTDALVRNDAYERVYTDVLADPELADLVEHLLGGMDVGRVDPLQARAATTSALRLAVPPSTLRSGTETFVAAVLAYIRGDVARLDADVDVAAVLDRVVRAAQAWVSDALAAAETRVTTSIDEYRAAVADFADRLRSGVLPPRIPVLEATSVDTAQVAAAVIAGLGIVDPVVRERVETAIQAGGQRDGLIDATADLVRARAADAAAELRVDLEGGRTLDVVAEVADRAGRSRAAVIGRLDTVRDVARWFGPGTAVLGVLLMVGSAGWLLWLERERRRRGALLVALAAIVAGLTVLVLWAVIARIVAAPLAPATDTGAGSWNLPAGLRVLLADVQSSLAADLTRTVRWWTLLPIAVGVAVLAGVLAASRFRLPSSRAVAIGGATAVLAGVLVWFVPGRAVARDDDRACNGAAELCDRAYDEVVYPATHNSMSSPDVVSVWPEHDSDIAAQLDAGVRALLIDTHHWTPLVSAEQLTQGDSALPPDVAQRVFETLGTRREPRDGTYLCHNQCALGAMPFVDALVTVREFLEDNPDDVVTLIIQDAISPEETEAAFDEARLGRYLHHHELGRPWATLGTLVDRDERLVVFAENEGPPPDWYHQGFEHMQDTPFRFASVDDMSCARNRGPTDGPLFLMNHWITRVTPDRATAATANAEDVIVKRARRCEAERGQLPNFVAVDFFGIGDLFAAVATLNELD